MNFVLHKFKFCKFKSYRDYNYVWRRIVFILDLISKIRVRARELIFLMTAIRNAKV